MSGAGAGASDETPPEDGSSRIAVVFNGSPLVAGDAGTGESGVRGVSRGNRRPGRPDFCAILSVLWRDQGEPRATVLLRHVRKEGNNNRRRPEPW